MMASPACNDISLDFIFQIIVKSQKNANSATDIVAIKLFSLQKPWI